MTALPSRASAATNPTAPPAPAPQRVAHLAAVDGTASQPVAQPRSKPRLRSDQLFSAGTDEIEIEHGEALYRLRITSLGKLILTK